MRSHVVTLLLAAALLVPCVSRADGGDGAKVLDAFLGYAFKNGNDFRVEARFVGRLLDSVLNAKASLEYRDPGLLRIDLERVEGRITVVLDLNAGEGFYHVDAAGMAVTFRAKEKPAAVEPGGLRKLLRERFSASPLETGEVNGNPALHAKRPDGSRKASIVFTPGYKSILRYLGYRPDGSVGFFVDFRDVGFGTVDPARFARPAGGKTVPLPEGADNPFDHFAAFAE